MAFLRPDDQPLWQRRLVNCVAILIGLFFLLPGIEFSQSILGHLANAFLTPGQVRPFAQWPRFEPRMLSGAILCSIVTLFGMVLLWCGIRDLLKCRKQPPAERPVSDPNH